MKRFIVIFAMVAVASPAVAASAPIPRTTQRAIAHAAGVAAYVPAFVPRGYRLASWTNDAAGSPSAGQAWFHLTFVGPHRLTWTVSLADPTTKCSDFSSSHARAGTRTVYYGQVAKGSSGRDAWICIRAGTRSLVVDAFDAGATVPVSVLGLVVATATRAG